MDQVDLGTSMSDTPEARMTRAKAAFTDAAAAALSGSPAAPALARAALEELNAARAGLRTTSTMASAATPADSMRRWTETR